MNYKRLQYGWPKWDFMPLNWIKIWSSHWRKLLDEKFSQPFSFVKIEIHICLAFQWTSFDFTDLKFSSFCSETFWVTNLTFMCICIRTTTAKIPKFTKKCCSTTIKCCRVFTIFKRKIISKVSFAIDNQRFVRGMKVAQNKNSAVRVTGTISNEK